LTIGELITRQVRWGRGVGTKRLQVDASNTLEAMVKINLKGRGTERGVTLTELMCVLAIIAILMALYLPTLSHAFIRVKKFLSGF
jgi:prepilin-type N-terminal cleavage/methylation domain-containing protein